MAEHVDVAALKDLIIWARENGVRLSQVSLGSIAVALHDPAIDESTKPTPGAGRAETPSSPYERWGGELLKQMQDGGEMNVVYEDDEG